MQPRVDLFVQYVRNNELHSIRGIPLEELTQIEADLQKESETHRYSADEDLDRSGLAGRLGRLDIIKFLVDEAKYSPRPFLLEAIKHLQEEVILFFFIEKEEEPRLKYLKSQFFDILLKSQLSKNLPRILSILNMLEKRGKLKDLIELAKETPLIAMLVKLEDRYSLPLRLVWLEAIKLLLSHGANPNLCCYLGGNSLMRAASAGDAELVRLLLDNKADIAPNSMGQSAFSLAFKAALSFPKFADSLEEKKEELKHESLPMARTLTGFQATLSSLMEAANNIGQISAIFGDAINAAVTSENTQPLRWLLSLGDNPNQKFSVSSCFNTALYHACNAHNSEAVSLLLPAGAVISSTCLDSVGTSEATPSTQAIVARLLQYRGDIASRMGFFPLLTQRYRQNAVWIAPLLADQEKRAKEFKAQATAFLMGTSRPAIAAPAGTESPVRLLATGIADRKQLVSLLFSYIKSPHASYPDLDVLPRPAAPGI